MYVKIHTRTILIAYKCDKGVYGEHMSPLYAKLGCHTLMSKVFILVTLQRLGGMVG